MNRVKAWLDKNGLKGKKLYAAIGVVAVLAVGLIVASLPGKSSKPPSTSTATRSALPPSSLGALAPKAEAIQMPAASPELFNVRVQQFIDETNKWKADRLKVEAEILGELRKIRESGGAAGASGKDVEDLRTRFRDLADQWDSFRREAPAGGGRAAPTDIPPLEIIRAPRTKESKPRSSVEGPAPSGPERTRQSASLQGDYWLPAGSMVKATLLNGVECPPATQGPGLPTLLLIRDAFVGPNASSVPMENCMALGRCDGDLSSERVKVGTSLISCVFPGGRTLDREAQGYVTGADGKLGVPGKLHDKRGRKLGMAVLAGFTAGLSQAIGQSEVTRVLTAEGTERTFVSGSTLTFGMSQALGSALAEVTNFYRQEMQRLFPVIEVPAGTEVTLILEHGVDVPEIGNLMTDSFVEPIR